MLRREKNSNINKMRTMKTVIFEIILVSFSEKKCFQDLAETVRYLKFKSLKALSSELYVNDLISEEHKLQIRLKK